MGSRYYLSSSSANRFQELVEKGATKSQETARSHVKVETFLLCSFRVPPSPLDDRMINWRLEFFSNPLVFIRKEVKHVVRAKSALDKILRHPATIQNA